MRAGVEGFAGACVGNGGDPGRHAGRTQAAEEIRDGSDCMSSALRGAGIVASAAGGGVGNGGDPGRHAGRTQAAEEIRDGSGRISSARDDSGRPR
ncbi:hypothetical protein GCM10023068_03020 [Leifsonia shinshuensis]